MEVDKSRDEGRVPACTLTWKLPRVTISVRLSHFVNRNTEIERRKHAWTAKVSGFGRSGLSGRRFQHWPRSETGSAGMGTAAWDSHLFQTARGHMTFPPRARPPHEAPCSRQLGDLVPKQTTQPFFLSSPNKGRVLRECTLHLWLSKDSASSGIYNALSLNVSSQPHRGWAFGAF